MDRTKGKSDMGSFFEKSEDRGLCRVADLSNPCKFIPQNPELPVPEVLISFIVRIWARKQVKLSCVCLALVYLDQEEGGLLHPEFG